MKKVKIAAMALVAIAAFLFLLTDPSFYNNASDTHSRSINRSANNTGGPREIIPSNYISSQEAAAMKNRTILIYMNGSDLESEHMAATSDLQEIFNSGYDRENINIIIFTGGTRRWHTAGIPNRRNAIFRVDGDKLIELARLGRDPMGYPETLAGFINFGHDLYPAEEFSLILWNHGGGAIVGFGHDEWFDNPDRAMMQLSEIESALLSNNLYKSGRKLEILGFDTCLMGTVEMALVAEEYARYLVASEELEPDPGWDYKFLGDIKPDSTGEQIGRYIITRFAEFYENASNPGHDEITTLSMTDLSKINKAGEAFERFAVAADKLLEAGDYKIIARARSQSRMFGGHGEHAEATDMIDLRDFLRELANVLPEQSAAAEQALSDAVIYKYARNIGELGGLAIYFPFENKNNLTRNLEIYKNIGKLPEYANFVYNFSAVLDGRPLVSYDTAFDAYNIKFDEEQLENLYNIRQITWLKGDFGHIQIGSTDNAKINKNGEVILDITDESVNLNGRLACLYLIDDKNMNKRYAIPVRLNEENADLLVVYSAKYPDGKITGAIPARDNMLDKKIVPIRYGDRISILYYLEEFDENLEMSDGKDKIWQVGEEFIIGRDGLRLSREKLCCGEEYLFGVSFSDLQGNDYYSGLVKLNINKK